MNNTEIGNLKSKIKKSLPLVVLLGDSIRMYYQSAAVEKLKEKAVVWAPEENCNDSTFMLNNLDKWLGDKKPAVIQLNCGLHDIFLSEKGEYHHSFEVYVENLRKIFKNIKENHKDTLIIFALTTPVDEARQKTSKTYGRLVRRNSDVDKINSIAMEIAKEFNIPVNDLHAPIMNAGVENMLVEDGIHLKPEAAEKLAAQTAAMIKNNL